MITQTNTQTHLFLLFACSLANHKKNEIAHQLSDQLQPNPTQPKSNQMLGKPIYATIPDWIATRMYLPGSDNELYVKNYWNALCKNPNVADFLNRHWDAVRPHLVWRTLSKNPGAVAFIEAHWDDALADGLPIIGLCENPNAMYLIDRHWDALVAKLYAKKPKKHQHPEQWFFCFVLNLCKNPNAAYVLDKHWEWVCSFLHTRVSVNQRDKCIEALCRHCGASWFLEKHWEDALQHMSSSYKRQHLLANPAFLPLLRKRWDEIGGYRLSPNNWTNLCRFNPDTLLFLCEHWNTYKGMVVWSDIAHHVYRFGCKTPEAVAFLEKHWNQIHPYLKRTYIWPALFVSPHAISFIEAHWEEAVHIDQQFSIKQLCKNPKAISLLEKHYAFLRAKGAIWWPNICKNPSADAIAFLERHLEDTTTATSNTVEVSDLWLFDTTGGNRISWPDLCTNPQPDAIQFVEKHWNRKTSYSMSENRRIDNWENLCANPAIFTLDWAAMRDQARPFAEELAARVFHPRRVAAALAAGVEVEDL